jgi:hypothetical protein
MDGLRPQLRAEVYRRDPGGRRDGDLPPEVSGVIDDFLRFAGIDALTC